MKSDYHHLRLSLIQKIDYSIGVIKKAEKLALKYDSENGFFLAFSGGKDSQCLYHIAQLAGVKFKAHFSPTSVDPPHLIRFIRDSYPDVEFGKLHKSIYTAAVERQILPTQKVRWCCSEFKENSGAGKVTLIGIRHEESHRRSKRNEFEVSGHKFSGEWDDFVVWREGKLKEKYKNLNHDEFSINKESEVRCINGKDSILVSPILHWTEKDVWDFLNGMEIKHCELYDKGHRRIGCILCPMSSYESKLRDIKEFPHVKRNWLKAIMKIRSGGGGYGISKSPPPITRRKDGRHQIDLRQKQLWGLGFLDDRIADAANGTVYTEEEIAENIFDWWISGKAYSEWYAEKFLQQKLDFGEKNNAKVNLD